MSDLSESSPPHLIDDGVYLNYLIERFNSALTQLQRLRATQPDATAQGDANMLLESALNQHLSDALDEIYLAIEPDLQKLAGGWIRSQQFQQIVTTRDFSEAVATLARSAFGAIIDALPTLHPDPSRNIRNLLISIARYDLCDQERKIYNPIRRQPKESDATLASGDPESAMWDSLGGSSSGERMPLTDIKDATSLDFEERLLTNDRYTRIWPLVVAFCHEQLTSEDRWLIKMRWFHEPALPFNDLAQQLGPGWTAAALRERHHRILKRIRIYLQERGVTDI